MICQFLAFPFLPGKLSEIKSVETLRRHVCLAAEAGFPDIAAEYLAEVERRESAERKAA